MGHAGLQIIKNQGQRQLHVTIRSEVKQASHPNTKTIQLQRMIFVKSYFESLSSNSWLDGSAPDAAKYVLLSKGTSLLFGGPSLWGSIIKVS